MFSREILEVKQVRMLFGCVLLCLCVMCQVSLVRAFVRSCVPRSATRLDEEMVLQQVRFLLLLSELFPVLSPELEAPSLVYASTPHVLPGSVIGQRWDSCSVSSALVLVCVRIVHYIWKINGAPQGTRGNQSEAVQWMLYELWSQCRFRISIASACIDSTFAHALLASIVMCVCDLTILLITGMKLSRTDFFCTAQLPQKSSCNFDDYVSNACLIQCSLTRRGCGPCRPVWSRDSGKRRCSAWAHAGYSHCVERGLGSREPKNCARRLVSRCVQPRADLVMFGTASDLFGVIESVTASWSTKRPPDSTACVTANRPPETLEICWQPLVSSDLDLVLILAAAQNIWVPSPDRQASAKAAARSLARVGLNTFFDRLSASKPLSLSRRNTIFILGLCRPNP